MLNVSTAPFPCCAPPSLLTMDRRLSAGCEMIAAATPAITPEDRETPTLVASLMSLGFVPIALLIFSAA